MVVSLFGVFAPVKEAQAAEGNIQWTAQPLPTGGAAGFFVLDNGANAVPTYFAVGPDGLTIYAINSALAANAAGCILKSIDGGQSFLAITAPGDATGVLSYVAISPTNPNVVVVAESQAAFGITDNVSVSTNGGVTWTALPAIAAVVGNTKITGLAISPDRADSLLNRDYVVAVSDNVGGNYAGVQGLQIIGATPLAGWVSFGTAARDYLAVAFSPNYLGDHAVLAVQVGAGGTSAEVWNNNWPAIAPALYPTTAAFPRLLNAAAVEAAVVNQTADIAMPIDFDPTSPAGMRFWVGVASGVAEPAAGAGGIYRVDAAQNPELLAIGLTGTRVNSVAYSGAVAGGTLFAGFQLPGGINALCATVSYTTQAQSNLPVWTPCLKPPTGAGVGGIGRPIVRVSPGFTADKKVYAMTTGPESAFSVSTDAGVSFNQKAIINLGAATVGVIDGLVLTPDGKTLFVSSRDGLNNLNVWQTATAPSPISWSRIWCATPANTRNLIALNSSGWATAPEIYLVNTTAGTPNGMFASYDGGASFNVRSTPNVTTAAISVASSKVVFIANGVAAPTTVYKSTVGGSVWGSPLPANANAIVSLATVGNDVLVGGTGACSRSTDGGTSFVSLTTAGLTANGFICIPDENYATNKIVYAGDTAAVAINTVYRINADTGAIWENILNPVATAIVGMGMSNGAFYAQSGGAAIACDRTLGPRDATGTITWRTMNIPASANVILRFSVAQNKVYVSTGAATLWAYGDSMATAKTKLNTPAGGAKIAVDPVSGRAEVLMVSWDAMGSGTGLANTYTFGIFEKAQGVPGASFIGVGPMPIPTAPRCSIWPSGPSGGPAVTAPDFVYTFLAGVEYGIIIRAADEVSADTIVSPWSDPVYFTIEATTGIITAPYAGPQLQAPTPGAMGVSLTPGFAWAPVSGAVSYEFELSKSPATTARGYFIDALVGLTGTNALVTPGWQCNKTLSYSTSYFWHVKGINATGGESIWGTAQFTTIPAGVFTCPLDGLTFATQAELQAHNAAAHAPVIPQTPAYIWAVVIIGALLVIVVIVLIVKTRTTH
jgi:hypothetical protein